MKIIRIILVIICLSYSTFFYSQNGNDQNENDINRTFALNFLNENVLILKNIGESNRIYNPDIVKIEVESLGNYNSNISFYKFELGKNKIIPLDKKLDITLQMSSCQEYVIAFNIENHKSYRIKGFDTNDLLFLIRDVDKSLYKRKKVKNILKELNDLSTKVDFICIYNSLKKMNFDSECLKDCIDGKKSN